MSVIDFKTVLSTEIDSTNTTVGDLFLTTDGDLATIDNNNTDNLKRAAAQGIKSRLQLLKGEYFLNLLEGIPYFTHILTKNPSFPLIKGYFSAAIFTYPGVVSIPQLELNLNRNTRELSVTLTVKLDKGVTITSEDFGNLVLNPSLPTRDDSSS